MNDKKLISLDKLPLNCTGEIEYIKKSCRNYRRLLEMGFTKGCSITPLYLSPMGDPAAYCIRGTVIALRKEDASDILIVQKEGI